VPRPLSRFGRCSDSSERAVSCGPNPRPETAGFAGNAAAGLLARVMPGQPSLSPKVVRLTLRVVRRILSYRHRPCLRVHRGDRGARPPRLGLAVVRLELGVAGRPRRRGPPTVLDRGEVPFAEAGQARSVHFRAAADHVVHAGDERAAGAVEPPLGGARSGARGTPIAATSSPARAAGAAPAPRRGRRRFGAPGRARPWRRPCPIR
jgi:hypothetical protein